MGSIAITVTNTLICIKETEKEDYQFSLLSNLGISWPLFLRIVQIFIVFHESFIYCLCTSLTSSGPPSGSLRPVLVPSRYILQACVLDHVLP